MLNGYTHVTVGWLMIIDWLVGSGGGIRGAYVTSASTYLCSLIAPAHRQVRATLTNLARKVNSLRVDEFDLQQLKNLNIHVDLITLDETSPHKPSYFAPYPGRSIPEPNDDDLGGAYNGLDDETEHSLTRPADRAYVMDIHLSSYISYYDLNAKGERAPWTSKW